MREITIGAFIIFAIVTIIVGVVYLETSKVTVTAINPQLTQPGTMIPFPNSEHQKELDTWTRVNSGGQK